MAENERGCGGFLGFGNEWIWIIIIIIFIFCCCGNNGIFGGNNCGYGYKD